jgi:hypothetical protein
VRSSHVEHVEALIDYRDHVGALSRELAMLDTVSGVGRGDNRGDDDDADVSAELADLLATNNSDQDAADQLRELSEVTRANAAAIDDVIELLGRDITRLEPPDD